MKTIATLLLLGAFAIATPAVAHHPEHADIPYATRGACEAASADLSNDDIFWLPDAFPELFDTTGQVASFLTRAFTCDRNASDGHWYITDYRQEILDSEWFKGR